MDDVAPLMVPITFFAMVAAIFIVPRYFKSQERQKLQETLKAAIQSGQPLPPEMIEAISSDVKTPPSPARDLRSGIIWLAIALGLVIMGFAFSFEEPDVLFFMCGIAALPGVVGAALVVLSFVGRGKN